MKVERFWKLTEEFGYDIERGRECCLSRSPIWFSFDDEDDSPLTKFLQAKLLCEEIRRLMKPTLTIEISLRLVSSGEESSVFYELEIADKKRALMKLGELAKGLFLEIQPEMKPEKEEVLPSIK